MTDFDIMRKKIADEVSLWFVKNSRDLPWRKTNDPYKIWLSEIILQQTRVNQGLPYYQRLISIFPTISDLANAPIDHVLRQWQGLGYYSRGRNLHACAKMIMEKYHGIFPTNRDELRSLPGIGEYTSAAIASFAFGQKEAVVDGNVIRVITRLFGIDTDIRQSTTKEKIRILAELLIPDDNPAEYNQAIMEFGAIQCIPHKPNCQQCCLASFCEGYRNEQVDRLPFKSRNKPARIRYFNYLVLEFNNRLFLQRRVEKDIWNGLYEFFLIESKVAGSFDEIHLPAFLDANRSTWLLYDESATFTHVLSHQKILCRFYQIKLFKLPDDNDGVWKNKNFFTLEEAGRLPKSILIARYISSKINSPE